MTNPHVQFRFMDCQAEFDIGPGCYLPNTTLKSHRGCEIPKTLLWTEYLQVFTMNYIKKLQLMVMCDVS
jgi:hypothetical protein